MDSVEMGILAKQERLILSKTGHREISQKSQVFMNQNKLLISQQNYLIYCLLSIIPLENMVNVV